MSADERYLEKNLEKIIELIFENYGVKIGLG